MPKFIIGLNQIKFTHMIDEKRKKKNFTIGYVVFPFIEKLYVYVVKTFSLLCGYLTIFSDYLYQIDRLLKGFILPIDSFYMPI